MKNKLISYPTLTMFAATVGLICAASAQAQYVTGDQYLDNMTIPPPSPGAVYANWSASDLSDGSSGLNVNVAAGNGFGSMYYVIPGAQVQYPLSTADTLAVLTLTFNSATGGVPPNWIGVYFTFSDNGGETANLGGYGGSGNPGNPSNWLWNGNTLSITAPIPAAQISAINAAGGDAVYTFNLGIDGSTLGPTSAYNVTFNSLELVPEPATMALFGLGAAGLLAIRRRK